MASVSADSELLKNYVSARYMTAGKEFQNVLDEKRRPMVFSISSGDIPKLQLIKSSDGESHDVLDMGPIIGLPQNARIQTMGVSQASDLTIYLCLAIAKGDNSSTLIVVRPFRPETLHNGAHLAKVPGDSEIGSVSKIYMTSAKGKDFAFPTVIITYKPVDQTRNWGSDIIRIEVQSLERNWVAFNNFATPKNAEKILDIAPAVSVYGQGIFALYLSRGKKEVYVHYQRPDQDDPNSVLSKLITISCPPDTQCVSSVIDQRAQSGMFIGATDGLHYVSSQEISSGAGGRTVGGNAVKGIEKLTTVQDGTCVTCWFKNSQEELGYFRADVNALDNGYASMLLPAGQATNFSACLSQPNSLNGEVAWQTLISKDQDGNLTLLEQGSDVGLWRTKPFFVECEAENIQNILVESYTITIKVRDDKGIPIPKCEVFLSASATVSAFHNGQNSMLLGSGSWFTADETGSLDFIVPTKSLAAQILKISKLKPSGGAEMQLPKAVVVDPAKNAMVTLQSHIEKMKSGQDLASAKTQSGEPLFPKSQGSDFTLMKHALESLQTLNEAYRNLPKDGSSALPPNSQQHLFYSTTFSLESKLGDALHWLKEKADKVLDYFVDKAGKIWKFVCHIGNEVKDFALDCIEKVCDAMSWVWEKLKVAWNKVVEFVGFLFNWPDIIQTKDTLSTLITAGLKLAETKVGDARSNADDFFGNLEKKIDGVSNTKISKDVSTNEKENSVGGNEVKGIQSSVAFNWATERAKNARIVSSAKVNTNVNTNSDAGRVWTQEFKTELTNLKGPVEQVAREIAKFFVEHGKMAASELMSSCKGVLKAAVRAIGKLVHALLDLVEALLKTIEKYGGATISIPIFSALYKEIAKHDLTAFDAICLILAIPTTVFVKAITQQAPPKLPAMNAELLEKMLTKLPADAPLTLRRQRLDFERFVGGTIVAGVLCKAIFDIIKLGYKYIAHGANAFEAGAKWLACLSLIIDIVIAMGTFPTDPTVPGFEYRRWVSYTAFYRSAVDLLVLFTPAVDEGVMEKGLLVFKLLAALITFGLAEAADIAEVENKAVWRGYDDERNTLRIISDGLTLVSGVGYFLAYMFREDQPEVTVVGVIVLEAGYVGLGIAKGLAYKREWDLSWKNNPRKSLL